MYKRKTWQPIKLLKQHKYFWNNLMKRLVFPHQPSLSLHTPSQFTLLSIDWSPHNTPILSLQPTPSLLVLTTCYKQLFTYMCFRSPITIQLSLSHPLHSSAYCFASYNSPTLPHPPNTSSSPSHTLKLKTVMKF